MTMTPGEMVRRGSDTRSDTARALADVAVRLTAIEERLRRAEVRLHRIVGAAAGALAVIQVLLGSV